MYLLTWKNISHVLNGEKSRLENCIYAPTFLKNNKKSLFVHIEKVQIEKRFKGYKQKMRMVINL